MNRLRRHRRQNLALLAAATAVGLWWGVSAPGQSPVAPTAPPPVSGPAAPAVAVP